MAQSSINKCTICHEYVNQVFCYECKEFLCDKCLTWHNKFPATKKHTTVHPCGGRVDMLVFSTKLICQTHNLEFIHRCKTCECFTCRLCDTCDHCGHVLLDIANEANSLRATSKGNMETLKGKLNHITTLLKDLKEKETKLDEDNEKFKNDLKSVSDDLLNIIESKSEMTLSSSHDSHVVEQQNLKFSIARLEQTQTEYGRTFDMFEKSLQETHDTAYLVKHDPIETNLDNLENIITEVPRTVKEFNTDNFITEIVDKIREKYTIRSFVTSEETIKELSENLAKQNEKLEEKARLLELSENQLQAECERSEKLELELSRLKRNIFVRHDGKTISLSLDNDIKIKSVKKMIESKLDIPAEDQSLHWSIRELKDDCSILDYGLSNDCTLELTQHRKKLIKISIIHVQDVLQWKILTFASFVIIKIIMFYCLN